MKNMTLWNLARVCQGRFLVPAGTDAGEACPKNAMAAIRAAASREAAGIVLDSRKVCPGYVFVATAGERADGHTFIPEVFEKGAIGVICEKEPNPLPGPCIVVKDSFAALRAAAAFYREQLPVSVVGITGSVGEMWMNHFGEMHRLSEIAKPDICVITNIGQCHLENLGSRDGILQAKSEIFDFMNPEGSICLFGDDDKLETIRQVRGIRPLRFGFSAEKNEIYGTDIENRGLFGSAVTIHADGQEIRAEVPLPGIHMVQNALAAAAVGVLMGLSLQQIADGIASVQAVKGRGRLLRSGGLVLIDDCYNANPVSVKAALDLLKLADGRKVAVLGDMFELGEQEELLHAQIGRYAAQNQVDCLLCAGRLSRNMYEAAKEAGMAEVFHYADRETLLADLSCRLQTGDCVLIKASHGMGFEKVVDVLIHQDFA